MPASVTYSCATNAVFLSGAAASVLAHARAQKRQHHSRDTYPLAVARAITFGWGGGHPPPRTSRACLFLPARAFSTTHARHRLFPTPQPLICSHTGAQPEAHSVVGSPSDLFTRTVFALSCPHRNRPRTQNQCSSYGAFVPAGHTIHTRTRLSHFASTVCTYRPIYLSFSFRLRCLLHNRLMHISHATLRAHSRPYPRPDPYPNFTNNRNIHRRPNTSHGHSCVRPRLRGNTTPLSSAIPNSFISPRF